MTEWLKQKIITPNADSVKKPDHSHKTGQNVVAQPESLGRSMGQLVWELKHVLTMTQIWHSWASSQRNENAHRTTQMLSGDSLQQPPENRNNQEVPHR